MMVSGFLVLVLFGSGLFGWVWIGLYERMVVMMWLCVSAPRCSILSMQTILWWWFLSSTTSSHGFGSNQNGINQPTHITTGSGR